MLVWFVWFRRLEHSDQIQRLGVEVWPGVGGCSREERERRVGGRSSRGGRVLEPVFLELAQLAEAAAALGAAVRPLTRVDALVLVQTVQVAETLLAVAAGVRPLARVDALVRLQAVEAPEASAADVAAVHFVSRLDGGHQTRRCLRVAGRHGRRDDLRLSV